jgi:hypothetical protein
MLTSKSLCQCRLKKQGLTPATKDTLEAGRKFPYVIFSAPPSGSQDYAAEVGMQTQGCLVCASNTGHRSACRCVLVLMLILYYVATF